MRIVISDDDDQTRQIRKIGKSTGKITDFGLPGLSGFDSRKVIWVAKVFRLFFFFPKASEKC
jgi:hypothetical protein